MAATTDLLPSRIRQVSGVLQSFQRQDSLLAEWQVMAEPGPIAELRTACRPAADDRRKSTHCGHTPAYIEHRKADVEAGPQSCVDCPLRPCASVLDGVSVKRSRYSTENRPMWMKPQRIAIWLTNSPG
ncbi:hypothetical protein OKW43_007497 [Paraburkholderia sp. WC7.3g]|uniref:hypothetical protein n=1 Tax=Paraburkholderia sp. WC7.3g TaxID=2991070 RepID=UPI003D24554D